MKALIFSNTGDPHEVLQLGELPDPKPGKGEVLVRMVLSPINPSDLHMIRGRYGYQPELPASPGAEGVGVVERLGEGVETLAPGNRVMFLRTWNLWRELVICRAEDLFPIPLTLSDETAAIAYTNPVTAWALTRSSHSLQEGDWLLQTAAASSVGKLVLQLAQVHKFRTINVVRRREQEEIVRSLGGDEVVCTADEDLRSRMTELTDGHGVTHAIDCVAGELGAEVTRGLAPGGTLLVYGALSTHRQTDPAKFTMPIFSPKLIYTTAKVQGWWIVRWTAAQPTSVLRACVGEILSLLGSGTLTVPEVHVFPVSEYRAALRVADGEAGDKKILVRF
ncbi:NADPH2:quinone reductase [Silvibacterium bohemicum]|uniref:enoyl-[acyl-carrier-protein] reductase n=1 Tax=Silvibacterium bohemicum TaxID=1577686 RepID=A0A841K061_9BACT|nr:zinc-dependent alcohol dehydrogenase family protein [Silvibacterium bohemicum]MBB6146790.1 NADPH2:quinone reductase [Silvibacterium bohemicum]